MTLYPLRFEPIFKSMLWGGRRLPAFLNREPPHDDPVGEAWVLSDVDGHASRVADGPLAGTTLRELLARDPARIVGTRRGPARQVPASAEVHRRATGTLGPGSPERRTGREGRAGDVRQNRGVGDPRPLRRNEQDLRGFRRRRDRRSFPRRARRENDSANAAQLHAGTGRLCVPRSRHRPRHRREHPALRSAADERHHLPALRLGPRGREDRPVAATPHRRWTRVRRLRVADRARRSARRSRSARACAARGW